MRRSFSQTRWYHQVIENFQFLQVRSIAEYIVAESIVYKKISSDIRWHAKRCGQYIRTLNNRVTRYLALKRSVDIKAHPFALKPESCHKATLSGGTRKYRF